MYLKSRPSDLQQRAGRIPGNVEKTKSSIMSAEKRLNDINNELALPFEHTDELNKIIRRKTELDSQLNLDKVTDDGIGMEEEPEKAPKITL